MKRLFAGILSVACALAITATAAEGKKAKTDEQKALQKEMLDKYDANKDGKLDKEERAKMSAADKERMEKAGLNHHKKKADKSANSTSSSTESK